jgi:hypothetical protein
MLTRHSLPTGHVVLLSPRLSRRRVPHAFTTTVQGYSVRSAGDLEPLMQSPEWAGRSVVISQQVHGCGVTHPSHRPDEADAHVTDRVQECVAVRTADCVPILLSSADGSRVAAIHAGWRGLVAGVIPATLRHFDPADVWGAIGPCICSRHYEVGPEVASQFDTRFLNPSYDHPHRKAHLDLRAVALAQIEHAGVKLDRLDISALCTYEHPELLPSYRRDGKGCAHLAAVVGAK